MTESIIDSVNSDYGDVAVVVTLVAMARTVMKLVVVMLVYT